MRGKKPRLFQKVKNEVAPQHIQSENEKNSGEQVSSESNISGDKWDRIGLLVLHEIYNQEVVSNSD
ncbi:hypothetical protein [Cytobacillus dafuensis]|uniref:Uncharacterized protein n=1 Tax=Cytobacillus dafuensis TaxID=1742359 RepID=A0A5B8Z0Z6_CYTDA|nr:hypothetical protein [Cytobacillus dafuensis]QED46605.1 hypothetical protein FSZ17_04555 [Cytobacillus dafuensis]